MLGPTVVSAEVSLVYREPVCSLALIDLARARVRTYWLSPFYYCVITCVVSAQLNTETIWYIVSWHSPKGTLKSDLLAPPQVCGTNYICFSLLNFNYSAPFGAGHL